MRDILIPLWQVSGSYEGYDYGAFLNLPLQVLQSSVLLIKSRNAVSGNSQDVTGWRTRSGNVIQELSQFLLRDRDAEERQGHLATREQTSLREFLNAVRYLQQGLLPV